MAGMPGGGDPAHRLMARPGHVELDRVVREHAGRLAAALVHLVGDFSAAEDLVQDAIEAAAIHWPIEGIPDRPDAWLYTVARRRGLDVLRRERADTGRGSPWFRGRPSRGPTTDCA
jgi:predicted RNA polymerase sigma factor